MVVHGTLIVPWELTALELVEPAAYGDLVLPFEMMASPDTVLGTIFSNRFPTPAIAWGFLTDDPDEEFAFDGLGSPHYIMGGPLHPEGSYLEPTIGQIWPRIG